jgi:hypothetical protein
MHPDWKVRIHAMLPKIVRIGRLKSVAARPFGVVSLAPR